MKKLYCLYIRQVNLKNLKDQILEKTLVISIISSRCKNEAQKIFKEE